MNRTLFAFIACWLISGCAAEKHGAEMDTPERWQPHLKVVKLDPAIVPRIQECIYVPIYSHIYADNSLASSLLACTLSVRNTDPHDALVLTSVQYYSTDGKLLKNYVNEPVQIDPLSAANFVINRSDETGGAGANFMVNWRAQKKIVEPLCESIMVSTGGASSFAFTSRGVIVSRQENSSEAPLVLKHAEPKAGSGRPKHN